MAASPSRRQRFMGDKSPKSKQRDQKQKDDAKSKNKKSGPVASATNEAAKKKK
jgi:hypothetical protein